MGCSRWTGVSAVWTASRRAIAGGSRSLSMMTMPNRTLAYVANKTGDFLRAGVTWR
jgi:hypothetical protein